MQNIISKCNEIIGIIQLECLVNSGVGKVVESYFLSSPGREGGWFCVSVRLASWSLG